MENMGYLNFLVKEYDSLGTTIRWDDLYKRFFEVSDQKQSLIDFKTDLVDFLKKKVKGFEMNEHSLKINNFTSLTIHEQIKYFKFGYGVTEISLNLLYDSWKLKELQSITEYTKSLEGHLTTGGKLRFFFYKGNLSVVLK